MLPIESRELFSASWRHFQTAIEYIAQDMARNKRLIENHVSITEFEEIQVIRGDEMRKFEKENKTQNSNQRSVVIQWLSAFNPECEQDSHRQVRSICDSPGQWLLEDPAFQRWFDPQQCAEPLLWLSGIPGAGGSLLSI